MGRRYWVRKRCSALVVYSVRHRLGDAIIRVERNVHAEVSITGFLYSEITFISAESGDEVIGVRLRAVSYTKVIDDKAERDIRGFVLKETGGVWALMKFVLGEVRD
jgi:hypothetical protein